MTRAETTLSFECDEDDLAMILAALGLLGRASLPATFVQCKELAERLRYQMVAQEGKS